MTRKQARQERCREYEKGVAAIIGGFGFAVGFIHWVLPTLVDFIIYIGA